MSGARIAVTGATGFLGGHLVRDLGARGVSVLPVVRRVDERAPARSVELDALLADPTRLDGVDAIVHTAAVRHRHGVDAGAYRTANVTLVEHLLRAAAGRVRRFVHVSSVGVYGFPHPLPITEAHPYAPVTLYSSTKVEAEKLARRVAREVGVELVIVRPTIVYGPGDTNGMLDKTARMIRAGTYLLVGRGDNTLHHTFVSDIVDGIELAARSPNAAGDDFILAGPETTTLRKFSETVARVVGRKLPRLHIPLGVARAVASAVDVATYRGLAFAEREPPINNEKLDVMTVSIAFDPAKARALLGYAPRIGYDEGIRRALAGLGS
jgi:nucleoside-diphosphate-sugar epimerase